MARIVGWSAILLAGLAAGCTDSNSDDQSYGKLNGPAGSAGTKRSGDASSSGPTDGSANGDGACPRAAFRYDGGDCQCPTAVPNVCPGGDGGPKEVCLNVMTDPFNCGGCGKVCDPSVGCVGGMCATKANELASIGAGCGSLKMTYANNKIYLADKGHGVISSVATTGGTPAPLVTNELSPFGIVVGGGNIYWIDGGNQTVRTAKDTGGAATTLATGGASAAGPGMIHAITVSANGSDLYYAQDNCVYMVATSGTTTTKECAPPSKGSSCANIPGSACVGRSEPGSNGIPTALAVDATNVYYPTDQSGNIEIMSLATGLEFKVAESQAGLLKDTIYIRGGHLYWASGASVFDNTDFVIGPDAGIGGDPVGSIQGSVVTAFAVGSTSVYYGEDGIVDKSPPPADGGTVVTHVLVRNIPPGAADDAGMQQAMPNSIALDGKNVYFTSGDCKIMALADGPQ
jgi:hypothetical protein